VIIGSATPALQVPAGNGIRRVPPFVYVATIGLLLWKRAECLENEWKSLLMYTRPVEDPACSVPAVGSFRHRDLLRRTQPNLPLGAYVLLMIVFALSLDLIVGYDGIVTLGHSAYFGLGAYTAGILAGGCDSAATRTPRPSAAAALGAGLTSALLTGRGILRTHGITMDHADACHHLDRDSSWRARASWLTGGSDGPCTACRCSRCWGYFAFDSRHHRHSLLPAG